MSRDRRRRCRTGPNHRVRGQRRIGRHTLTTYAALRDQRRSHRSNRWSPQDRGAADRQPRRHRRRHRQRHRRNGTQPDPAGPPVLPVLRAPPSGPRTRRHRCRRELVHTRGTAACGRIRAERQSGPAQPGAGGHGDAKQIKNLQRKLSGNRSRGGYFRNQRVRRNCIAVPEAFLGERPNWLRNRDATRAAPLPHLFQTVTCGMVGHDSHANASVQNRSPTACLGRYPYASSHNHQGLPMGGSLGGGLMGTARQFAP